MITILIILAIVYLFYLFPKLKCFVFNIHRVIYYLPRDVIYYFKHKKYNNCVTGVIVAVVGLFGKGKTLTTVHIIANYYRRYDGKKVWCDRRKKIVTQKVKIISNVTLLIPYEKFVSLAQIIYSAENNQRVDDENDTLTVTLVLGDEFSTQMNSRNFKSNISSNLLNTILTCRHYHIAMYYTTQRFGLVDALLRQVTSYCVDCNKDWRLQGIDYYDAWEMENATNVLQLKPYKRLAWFVQDSDYEMYNTLAVVESLKKSSENGDMMSDEEILSLQNFSPNVENIFKPSRKFKKLKKKM